MRVTSEFFVSALIRRVMGEGGFAGLIRRGAAEAGAIFVSVDRLDGTYDLYGPAPQAWFEEPPEEGGGRLFERLLQGVDREAVTARFASEERMDPDFWVVEVEAAGGKVSLPLAVDGEAQEGAQTPPEDDPNRFFKF